MQSCSKATRRSVPPALIAAWLVAAFSGALSVLSMRRPRLLPGEVIMGFRGIWATTGVFAALPVFLLLSIGICARIDAANFAACCASSRFSW